VFIRKWNNLLPHVADPEVVAETGEGKRNLLMDTNKLTDFRIKVNFAIS